MKKNALVFMFISLAVISLWGCGVAVTYQSDYDLDSKLPLESYRYITAHPDSPLNQDFNVNQYIESTLVKKGFTPLSRGDVNFKSEDLKNETLVYRWMESGRNSRAVIGFSIEITVLLTDYFTGEIVYRGVGEYMGDFARDDYKGATTAALKGLSEYRGFDPEIAKNRKKYSLSKIKNNNDKEPKTSRNESDPANQLSSQGTGWLSSSGYLVTNAHVVDGYENIKIIDSERQSVEAQVILVDSVNDIALLKPQNYDLFQSSLPLSSTVEGIGTEVFTIGYPHAEVMGSQPKLTNGLISSTSGLLDDPRFYQISVPIQSGNSGSPLLNSEGDVVGVVTSKLNAAKIFQWTGDLPQNVNYAIKVQYLNSLIQSAPPITTKPSSSLSKQAKLDILAKRVMPAIFRVIAEN